MAAYLNIPESDTDTDTDTDGGDDVIPVCDGLTAPVLLARVHTLVEDTVAHGYATARARFNAQFTPLDEPHVPPPAAAVCRQRVFAALRNKVFTAVDGTRYTVAVNPPDYNRPCRGVAETLELRAVGGGGGGGDAPLFVDMAA